MMSLRQKSSTRCLALILAFLVACGARLPQGVAPEPNTPQKPVAFIEIFVAPTGSDSASGVRSAPLRTLTAAWSRVPESLNAAYRINLLPGTYPCEPLPEDVDNCINYFDNRHGAESRPLVLRAYAGQGTATVRGGLNLRNVDYLTVQDIRFVGGWGSLPTNSSGNNLIHIEDGSHIALRGIEARGPDCDVQECNNLQEVLKVNQAQYLDVEDSELSGAWHTVVDYFAVQHGVFRNNILHTAGQWCMYVKGGTAYLQIERNRLHDCQLGFQAGQSSNLAVMVAPWLHYEAYDIKFVNNLLHDIPGVGLSVQGAYNVLFAHNTLVHIAYDDDPTYPLVNFEQGERGCTPIDELPNVMQTCTTHTGAGGWGPPGGVPLRATENTPGIPNRSIYVINNVFYNPAPAQTAYAHFGVRAAIARPAGFANSPSPAPADLDVRIRGNVIWNGPADHPLGNEDGGSGCAAGHPTCSPAQIRAQNLINVVEPDLVDTAGGNYRPADGGRLFDLGAYDFFTDPADFGTWATFAPAVPAGALSNAVALDLDGRARTGAVVPGAYTASRPVVRVFAFTVYLPFAEGE